MKTENKEVLVLMSTYNGERYLRQQIDSILTQKGISVKLLVRDDGSVDGTLSILKEYKDKGHLDYYYGDNLGPQLSFMHLLQNAPESDYYAFSDQDDVWLPEKLSIAVNSLNQHENQPALYFCQTQLTDENLNKCNSVIIHPLLTFGESIIYKFVGGCTMVMNNHLRIVVGDRKPRYLRMHDIWIYFIAKAVDAYVFFDSNSYILYRQHGDNAIGQKDSSLFAWKQRFERVYKYKNDRYKQAMELMRCYGDIMSKENKMLLSVFLKGKTSFYYRLKIISNKDLRCADVTTQVLFWINVILNRY